MLSNDSAKKPCSTGHHEIIGCISGQSLLLLSVWVVEDLRGVWKGLGVMQLLKWMAALPGIALLDTTGSAFLGLVLRFISPKSATSEEWKAGAGYADVV